MKRIYAYSILTMLGLCLSPVAGAQGNPQAANLARQGSEAAKSGDWDKAIDSFRKATDMDKKHAPNLAAALEQRGAAYMSAQRFSDAADDFTEALKINPNDAGTYERRAYVEMKMTDYDKALADYSEAIKHNPHDARYYNLRAYILETKSDFNGAMADTDRALKIDKNNAEARARKERLQKIQAMNAQQQQQQQSLTQTPIPAQPTAPPKKKP
jgi:tetratricopeptide (TPR) repeat protein